MNSNQNVIPMSTATCEACGLPWDSPEPCMLVDGRKASLGLPHVKTQICACRTCVNARKD